MMKNFFLNKNIWFYNNGEKITLEISIVLLGNLRRRRF